MHLDDNIISTASSGAMNFGGVGYPAGEKNGNGHQIINSRFTDIHVFCDVYVYYVID